MDYKKGYVYESMNKGGPTDVRIATINHDMNKRHTKYTYGKVTIG